MSFDDQEYVKLERVCEAVSDLVSDLEMGTVFGMYQDLELDTEICSGHYENDMSPNGIIVSSVEEYIYGQILKKVEEHGTE